MHTGCFKGQADCRMSASLFNWKMLNQNYIFSTTMQRVLGFVFNQQMVEQDFGKCSYIWDGASFSRYNHGCGRGATVTNCADPHSAFMNHCPSTGKICTANDTEVVKGLCEPFGKMPVPKTPTDAQCYFSGPALDYPRKD